MSYTTPERTTPARVALRAFFVLLFATAVFAGTWTTVEVTSGYHLLTKIKTDEVALNQANGDATLAYVAAGQIEIQNAGSGTNALVLGHDATDAVITSDAGDIKLDPASGAVSVGSADYDRIEIHDESSNYGYLRHFGSSIHLGVNNSGIDIAFESDADPSNGTAASISHYFDVGDNELNFPYGGGIGWDTAADAIPDFEFTGQAASANFGARVMFNNGTDALAVQHGKAVRQTTEGSGAPYALNGWYSGSVFTNEGTAARSYLTLDTAVEGATYTFYVQDADGIRITANTSDTIALSGAVSSAAGYIESTQVGASVELLAINATEWVATNWHGQWDVYDGASNPATELVAEMTMATPAASGTITPATPVKIGGTVAAGSFNRGFTTTTTSGGRLTYDGIATKKFHVHVSLSATTTENTSIMSFFVAEGGTPIAASEIQRYASTGADVGAVSLDAIVELATDEYIEIYCDLDAVTGTDTITVEQMTVTITEAN